MLFSLSTNHIAYKQLTLSQKKGILPTTQLVNLVESILPDGADGTLDTVFGTSTCPYISGTITLPLHGRENRTSNEKEVTR